MPYLLEAFSQLAPEYIHWKLVIIAPHTPEKYNRAICAQIAMIEQIIKDNYLHDRVLWIDPVDRREDLRLWMSLAQVGAIPSMNE